MSRYGAMDKLNRLLCKKSKDAGKALPVGAAKLPDWVSVGASCNYISKTQKGQFHPVIVKKIEERKRLVVIVFEKDKRIWKRVTYEDIGVDNMGVLRPLWKKAGGDKPKEKSSPADDEVADEAKPEETEAGNPPDVESDEEDDRIELRSRSRSRSPSKSIEMIPPEEGGMGPAGPPPGGYRSPSPSPVKAKSPSPAAKRSVPATDLTVEEKPEPPKKKLTPAPPKAKPTSGARGISQLIAMSQKAHGN